MRKLWQETFGLFRAHPVLWLPYILTELLATFLWRIRNAAAREIFEWLTTSRTVSVFGTMRTENLRYRDQFHMAAVYAPVGLILEFVCVCLFVFALVATARLVDLILGEQEPHLMTALKTTALRWRAILWFSLKSLLVYLAFMAIAAVLLFGVLWERGAPFQAPLFLSILELLFGTSIALLLTPAALRLLQGARRGIVDANVRKQGVILAVVVIASSFVLGYSIPKLESGMVLGIPTDLTAVCVANELLANAAISPFFIALSLLALRKPDEAEPPPDEFCIKGTDSEFEV